MESNFEKQGFSCPERVDTPWARMCFYPKIHAESAPVLRTAGGDFCAVVGTLIYKGSSGRFAQSDLLEDLKRDRLDRTKLYGTFCAVVGCNDRLVLFTDSVGTYHVWRDDRNNVFTTSFLAACSAVEQPRLDIQSCYEYVFQEASYGGNTLIEQLSLVDNRSQYLIDSEVRLRPVPHEAPEATSDEPIESHVERNLDNLRRYFEVISKNFGGRVVSAITGGYDSRLILALLMEAGVKAHYYVYGGQDNHDVVIAKRIAKGLDIEIEHIDQDARQIPALDQFPGVVERNFLSGHGQSGPGICNNGSELDTRIERCAGGALQLNGGGGVIFRNFLKIPDRRFSPREIIWSFYSRFDPRTCTALFDEARYLARLEDKLRKTLGVAEGPLDRMQVERAFPEFRSRYWMGKGNSINNGYSFALTPYIDANVIPDALKIPMAFKDFGRLHARMIMAVNPRVAAFHSDYGHGFDVEPPLRRRLKERAIYLISPRMRRYRFRLVTRKHQPRPVWLGPDYLSRVIDVDFPYARQLFDIEAVKETRQFNRIVSLEYFLERLNPDIVPSDGIEPLAN